VIDVVGGPGGDALASTGGRGFTDSSRGVASRGGEGKEGAVLCTTDMEAITVSICWV